MTTKGGMPQPGRRLPKKTPRLTRLIKSTTPPKRIPRKFTEENLRADAPEAESRTSVVGGRLDNEPIEDEGERGEEGDVLEELPEQTETRESPAQTRRELEIPESPVKEPGGAAGQVQAEAQAGRTAASKAAAQAGGRAAATEAAGTAAAGVTQAGATAGAVTGAATAAETGAAIEFGPIIAIVGVVILVIGIIIALVFALRTGNRGQSGSTPPQRVGVGANADSRLIAILAKLAALAGDDNARNQQIAKILTDSDIETLLDQLEQDIGDAPYHDAIKQTMPDARDALIQLKNGSYISGQSKSSAPMVKKLLDSLNRIVALTRGINLTSAQDIANIAQAIVQDNQQKNSWIYISQNTDTNNTDTPANFGIYPVNGKQGCDPAGFVYYVLTRKKEAPLDKGIFCKECIAPAFNTLTKYFSPILTVFAATGSENLQKANFQVGDIVLIKPAGPEAERDAYIITNNTDNSQAAAHCSRDSGPANVNYTTLQDSQLLRILRYRYDNTP